MKTKKKTIILIVIVIFVGVAFQATLLIGDQLALKEGREEMGGFCESVEVGDSVEGLSSLGKKHGFRVELREELTKCNQRLANCEEGDVLSQIVFRKVYGYFKSRRSMGFECMIFFSSNTERITEVRYIEGGDDVFRITTAKQ